MSRRAAERTQQCRCFEAGGVTPAPIDNTPFDGRTEPEAPLQDHGPSALENTGEAQ
jgi:hypothetical protein